MTRLSSRLAVPGVVLCLAAAAVVWVRALGDPSPDDCGDALRADAVEELAGTIAASERPDLRGRDDLQWTEGEIAPPGGDVRPLRFRIVRSSRPASLYKEPVAYFSLNPAPDAQRGIRWLDVEGERLPVHWRYDDSEFTYVIEYLFVQDGRPVRHPLTAGLANAARQVRDGTRPVTLLLVDGLGPSTRREAIERTAEAWLAAAWQRYSAGCRESGVARGGSDRG